MRVDVPPSEVMRQSFWLGGVLDDRDLRMHRLAGCIARIRPSLAQAAQDYDDRCLVWALTAIAVHLAAEMGDTAPVSAMLRSSARLLELAADAEPPGRRPVP